MEIQKKIDYAEKSKRLFLENLILLEKLEREVTQ